MPDVTFPVVVLTADDSFLHVFTDLETLREHVVEDLKIWARTGHAAADTTRELQFFDGRGHRLTPRLGPSWLLTGVEVAADSAADEAGLLARMEAAARHAEEVERKRRREILAGKGFTPQEIQLRLTESPSAPVPLDGTVLGYAKQILAIRDDEPDGEIPGGVHSGGWMHNAWHAAFG